jgi:membrane fusion protein (multidrug efflux system)
MRKAGRVGFGLAAVAVIGLGVAMVSGALPIGGGAAKTEGKAEVPLEFQPREVARPQTRTMPERITFSGPLVAPSTAVVRAKAAGTLQALSVREGDRVRAGQALGQVDPAELGSRVLEREAVVAQAQAALAQAERTHASNQELAARQFISPNALEQSRAALDGARAQWQAARAALQAARVGLRDVRLVAPIDGIVAKRHVLPGEEVSPEQQVLTLVDLRRLELDGSVGTHEVARLAPGLDVEVRVEGVVQPVAGHIARIAPAAEPGTRSIGVTIGLANDDEHLRAGQYAVAAVTLDDPTPRLTVPVGAIGSQSGEDHVWLIEQGKLARRAVTLGRRDPAGGHVEVLQGLSADQTVLAARFENLKEGAPALVVQSDGSAGPESTGQVASAALAASAATTLK